MWPQSSIYLLDLNFNDSLHRGYPPFLGGKSHLIWIHIPLLEHISWWDAYLMYLFWNNYIYIYLYSIHICVLMVGQNCIMMLDHIVYPTGQGRHRVNCSISTKNKSVVSVNYVYVCILYACLRASLSLSIYIYIYIHIHIFTVISYIAFLSNPMKLNDVYQSLKFPLKGNFQQKSEAKSSSVTPELSSRWALPHLRQTPGMGQVPLKNVQPWLVLKLETSLAMWKHISRHTRRVCVCV